MARLSMPLANQVGIVTGGASGIGKALGEELSARGCEVVLADRQFDLAQEVARGIAAQGGRATAVELDVRDLAAFQAVVKDTVARSGRVDYLFNNAGMGVAAEMDNYRKEDWDEVIDVNLRGVAYGVQAVYPTMVRQRSGHIINTASMTGLVPSPGMGVYTATKHAVVGLSRALRLEAKTHGVRVSALCPGAIRTPILTGGKFGHVRFKNMTQDVALRLWDVTRPMPPQDFARQTLDAVARDEAVIIVPRWWKAFWYLDRLSPALSMGVWGAILSKMRRDLAAAGITPDDSP